MLLFLVILSQIIVYTSSTELKSFQFKTSKDQSVEISSVIKATLWFNYTIFSCDIYHVLELRSYVCNEDGVSSSWNPFLSTSTSKWTSTPSNPMCNNPQFKMMIDNSESTQPLMIDSLQFTDTNDNIYGADQFCIPDTINIKSHYSPIVHTSVCDDGYTAHSAICINNDIQTCAPPKQLIYLDINQPTQYIKDALWLNATNIDTEPLICITNYPTHIPTQYPSFSPTTQYPSFSPNTGYPSQYPSFSSTQYPSSSPSARSTQYPSFSPTTGYPSDHSIQYPSFNPTQYPSSSPSVRSTQYPSFSPTTGYPSAHSTQSPSFSLTTRDPTEYPSEHLVLSSTSTNISTETPSFNLTTKTALINLSISQTDIPSADEESFLIMNIDGWIVVVAAAVLTSMCIISCIMMVLCRKWRENRDDINYNYKELSGSQQHVMNETFKIAHKKKAVNIQDDDDETDAIDAHYDAYSL